MHAYAHMPFAWCIVSFSIYLTVGRIPLCPLLFWRCDGDSGGGNNTAVRFHGMCAQTQKKTRISLLNDNSNIYILCKMIQYDTVMSLYNFTEMVHLHLLPILELCSLYCFMYFMATKLYQPSNAKYTADVYVNVTATRNIILASHAASSLAAIGLRRAKFAVSTSTRLCALCICLASNRKAIYLCLCLGLNVKNETNSHENVCGVSKHNII